MKSLKEFSQLFVECSGKYQTSLTQGAPQTPTEGLASTSCMRTANFLVFMESISQLRNPRLDLPQRRKALQQSSENN